MKEDYDVFFKNIEEFMQQAEIHKRRGNNDFNPYLEMWSATKEVKLHSALLCGFLNPQSNHYQGDVFLEIFLNITDLKEWFGDMSDARVHREYGHIDMYITNGIRHIIVENKIWAGDQGEQIQRYIETIKEVSDEEESVAYENIAVLYLAPQLNKKDKRMPSEYSLGKWKIKGDYLEDDKGNKVRFKAISYDKEILEWIDASQKEVGCITSLNVALSFYKDVVQIITNTKENTMSLAKHLTKDKDNMKYQLEIMWDIFDMKEEICEEYSKAIIEKYKDEIEEKGFEIIETRDGGERREDWGKTWQNCWYRYVIKPKDCGEHYLAFCIEYAKDKNNGYGVRLFSKDSDYPVKFKKYLDVKFQLGWWYSRNGNSMRGAETALEKFLNNNKIKELNDKLKNYQP